MGLLERQRERERGGTTEGGGGAKLCSEVVQQWWIKFISILGTFFKFTEFQSPVLNVGLSHEQIYNCIECRSLT